MKRIALIPGHGPKIDRGAVNLDGTTELDWNRDLVNRILKHIGGRVPVVVVHRQAEKNPPVVDVNKSNASIACEFHLNAFDHRASGTEMLYWHSSKAGAKLAQALQVAAVRVLSLPDRGLKPISSGDRGGAFLRKTAMPAVIVESFFIDNSGDLAVGNAKKEELAKAYADVLVALA